MSSTDSESESGRGGEEEEEEEGEEEEGAQRSSEEEEEEAAVEQGEEEEEEEEGNGEEDEDDGEEEREVENGHTSPPRSTKKRKSSTAVANGRSRKPTKSAALTTLAFPISRVRRLVKSEVEVQQVGVEAGFLIAKAAELFLEKFVEDAFDKMTENERTVLCYKDLASHVSTTDRYDFLADFIPEMVPASTALSAKAPQTDK